MADDVGFTIDGWDDFVKSFSEFVDKWEAKKEVLLKRMGAIYVQAIKEGNYVPVDTSRLIDSITVFGDGIPQDYVEVGTPVPYAKFVNDGHVQHRRFLPADRLSVGGKTKYLKNKNQKGIMLSEMYVKGAFFMEKGFTDAKPRLERLISKFMEDCAREVEGGKL